MTIPAQDIRWMQRALELARRGIGLASPNPAVGCVIVDRDGELIGEGWHEYDLIDHAEVAALKAARQQYGGDRLRGGTAYVTLEPCNHTGRTGPCTQALIAAELSRVVAATTDPNPNVSGHGMDVLKDSGIQTTVGVCEADGRRINEGFAKWIQHKRPFVVMKIAMTLDGRIAPRSNLRSSREPYWITSEKSRAAVQNLRRQADAIVTGVNTVIADDPLLTDRSGQARRRPLLRVILDSALRTPHDSRIVRTAKNDLIIFTVSTSESRARELRSRGVDVKVLPSSTGRVPLAAVLDRLGCEGNLKVLTETGSGLNTAFLDEGLVDRLEIFVSPQIMGSDAVPAFESLGSPIRLNQLTLESPGEDLVLGSLLSDPWRKP